MHTLTFIPKVIHRFLNLAGLLTCVLTSTFPSFKQKDSGIEEKSNIVPPMEELLSLQLREQLRIYTGFPFNAD